VVKDKMTACRRKTGKAPSRSREEGSDRSRLNDLYREHGLPLCQPPAAWSAGEQRGHGDPEVAAFAEGVHRRSAAKPRAKRKTATSE
jgi:hypothetical protein